MKKYLTLKLFATLFLICGIVNCAIASIIIKKDSKDTLCRQKSYLFVQSADYGTLKLINKNTNDYTFTLKGVDGHVVYFTDRPNRVAGVTSIENFLEAWNNKAKNNFAADAPNASVAGVQIHWAFEKKPSNYVLTLTNPKYNAKNETLTYEAKLLGTTESVNNVTIKNVALFFDDTLFCPGCE